MKTLNLVDIDKSDIKYHINKFPDGQQNIVIDKSNGALAKELREDKTGMYITPSLNSVKIKSRLNNWLDLELITCAVASLRELDITEIHLYVPYIMGARSDRKFKEGGNNYVKHVIAPALNNLKLRSVTCIDPHSSSLECCLNNFKKISNESLFRETIRSLYGLAEARKNNNFVLVSPDAGAAHKIYKLAQDVDYKGDIITCSKDRDKDGRLTKTIVPLETNKLAGTIIENRTKDYIIIDDICDGGATFINIAKELKKQFVTGKIYLIVTHSIFSKGTDELLKYFDKIFTTNSYKEHDIEKIKVLNIF